MLKPMLACHALDSRPDLLYTLKYPLIVMPKHDGYRIRTISGSVLSRTGKRIKNRFIQKELTNLPANLDAEVVCMTNNVESFTYTQSCLNSFDGEFQYNVYVFDSFENPESPYMTRLGDCLKLCPERTSAWSTAKNASEVFEKEAHYLCNGKEGVILRSLDGVYKFGRTTLHEGSYLSFKRSCTDNAFVIGYKQQMVSGNTPVDKLGSFECTMLDGVTCDVGSGFTDAQRTQLWKERDTLIGREIEYKYQSSEYTKRRFPVFVRFV